MLQSFIPSGTRDPVVAYPDETIRDAVERMLRRDIGRLMVVSRKDKTQFLGYLGRSKVMQCWLGPLDQELVRERFRPAFFRSS